MSNADSPMGKVHERQLIVIVSGVPAVYFSAGKPASPLDRQLDKDLFK